ncbi:MAG: (2Fe-2S) ferredoxin domain-containing protein, partial [Armatimonadetes bacterium]|nr:(2Fe-2S) ferredoxin domain-containing protein [Armatimonadota bacterium]
MAKLQKDDLEGIIQRHRESSRDWIAVGMGSCGLAAGADAVYRALEDGARERGLEIDVRRTGCLGACHAEPLVEVQVEGVPKTLYGHVSAEWV